MPWKLNHSELNPQVEDENDNYVCQVWGTGTPEGRRNARMICVAPEMYKLLKTMCDSYASFSYDGDEKRAEKILRKIDKDEKEKMQR